MLISYLNYFVNYPETRVTVSTFAAMNVNRFVTSLYLLFLEEVRKLYHYAIDVDFNGMLEFDVKILYFVILV